MPCCPTAWSEKERDPGCHGSGDPAPLTGLLLVRGTHGLCPWCLPVTPRQAPAGFQVAFWVPRQKEILLTCESRFPPCHSGWHRQHPKPLSQAVSHPKPTLVKKRIPLTANRTPSTNSPWKPKPPPRRVGAFVGLNKAANPPAPSWSKLILPPRRVQGRGVRARLARHRHLTRMAQLQADKAVSHVIHNVDFMLAVTIYEGAAEVLHLIRNQQCLCL